MKYAFPLFFLFILTACGASTVLKEQTAMRYASPAHMIPRVIDAGPFTLKAYERMHTRHAAANLYIEGDGLKNLPPMEFFGRTTPDDPVALHMASKDKADNVAYLARPCQYESGQNAVCEGGEYEGSARMSDDVIAAYNKALNNIKAMYDIKGFHLIGHGGGGGIASILAAERGDVLSLRTVAGILDHDVYTAARADKMWAKSNNPVDYVAKLRSMPQWHFIGSQDDQVPPSVLQSYLQALHPSECVSYDLIQENEHINGWVEKWPELFAKTPRCEISPQVSDMPSFMPVYEEPEPFRQPRVMDMNKGGLVK
jgi:hypothetical protein